MSHAPPYRMVRPYRIVRLQHDGHLYTPVIAPSGTICGPQEVTALAIPRPVDRSPATWRRLRAVLADEGPRRDGEESLDLTGACWRDPVPLTFGGSELEAGLPVGVLERIEHAPQGFTPGTVGRHLLGTACLVDSLLADVIWEAVREGILDGVCVHVRARERDATRNALTGVTILSVDLGAGETSCLVGARVLHWREDSTCP